MRVANDYMVGMLKKLQAGQQEAKTELLANKNQMDDLISLLTEENSEQEQEQQQ